MGREHEKHNCWCGHPEESHRWDAVRDYREYECLACKPWRTPNVTEKQD